MIAWYIILGVLLIHWLADFILQTDWEAKSTNNEALTSHVAVYTCIWIIPAMIVFGPGSGLVFLIITYMCHWITDYFTSRLNTLLWKKNAVHNFFVSIGFDQILHYVQLFGLYLLLK